MSWNYRIIRHHHPKGDYLSLHEVYYDQAGRPNGYTVDPISFTCAIELGPEDIAGSLERALADARRHTVLDVSEFPPIDALDAEDHVEELPVDLLDRQAGTARRAVIKERP